MISYISNNIVCVSLSQVQPSVCQAYYLALGEADFSLFSSTLAFRRDILFEDARRCLVSAHTHTNARTNKHTECCVRKPMMNSVLLLCPCPCGVVCVGCLRSECEPDSAGCDGTDGVCVQQLLHSQLRPVRAGETQTVCYSNS